MEDETLAPIEPESDDFIDALSDASLNFDASLRAKFPETEYKKLRTIGAFIMRGLSLEESCVLARVSKSKLDMVMEVNEDVRAFINFKKTAYKAALLNTLTSSATTGRQSKSAGYLLEKKYPSEFDPKKVDDLSPANDALQNALDFVRRNSDSDPLVKRLPAHG